MRLIAEYACMHAYLSFLFVIQETTVYADVGPLSINRPRSPGDTPDFDEHGVEYAQLNHKVLTSAPVLSIEKSMNEGITLLSLIITCNYKVW